MDKLVGLVACCASKRDYPCAARDLYTSTLFKFSMRYVKARCQSWAILSAKHGLVLPDQLLAPYNLTLHSLDYKERASWASTVNKQLRETFPGSIFIVVAGEKYRACLNGLRYSVPFAGLGIGKQLQALRKEIS